IRTDIVEMIVIKLKRDLRCKDSDKSTKYLVNFGHFLLCTPAVRFCNGIIRLSMPVVQGL
ncbi:MAG: hypothetical protein ACI4BC_02280, partial [Muribaculaceae bacterium]